MIYMSTSSRVEILTLANPALKPAARSMYGSDFCGRKVNLLSTTTNTGAFTRPKLFAPSRPSTSSISSCASREGYDSSQSSLSGSPRHSHPPPTPPLLHLDSQSSISQSTPSPMSPQYGFEPLDQHLKREQNAPPYYNHNQYRINGYPSMQDSTPQPYYNLSNQHGLPPTNDFDLDPTIYESQGRTLQPLQIQLQQAATHQDSPLTHLSPQAFQSPSTAATAPATSTTLPPLSSTTATAPIKPDLPTPIATSNATSSSTPSKTPAPKKKYRCPHASRYACTDTFTTSGHAARHGKKHTGEKNIFCPTCNKAFTRKDNMKQHERTHKNGSRTASAAASPVISNKGGSRKGSDARDADVDEVGLGMGGPVQRRPKMARSELSEIMEGISKGNVMEGTEADMDADGESPGLDALATAASEMV